MNMLCNASRRAFYGVLLLLTLAMASCSSKRGATAPDAGAFSGDVNTLASQLAADSLKWHTMSVPVGIRVKDSGLPSLSGTLSMRRDLDISISLRFLGMEMGALYVTADSVWAYVKPQKIYLAESIPELLGGFPATVGNLQSLLLGRLFTLGDNTANLGGAEILEMGRDTYTITPRSPQPGLDYGFGVKLPANTISAVAFSRGTHSATVLYPEPGEADIEVTTPGRKMQAEITLSLDRAESDASASSRRFAIPKGYKRVCASSLLKLISQQ
ncbi:MAG: DUF4292 domain-containing protein [Muribaculaceae bacterium]|nr:DUF4292 domain-containing protein [Muribaculaceae bacterium]